MQDPTAVQRIGRDATVTAVRCCDDIAFSSSAPQPEAAGALRGTLHAYFEALFAAHGPQHWWPGRTRFEIIAGAILTQNTSWKNVERAIANLRHAKLLSPRSMSAVRPTALAVCLRPAGYFRQKAKTLKAFVAFLYAQHAGSLNRLFATPTAILRTELLAIRGIGPETADSILLYAGRHPVFVVDAYSRRILERHALAHPKSTYEELRATFESSLPRDHQLFNEFHALIVHTGKHFCRKSDPACHLCPLQPFLPPSAAQEDTSGAWRVARGAKNRKATANSAQIASHIPVAGRRLPVASS